MESSNIDIIVNNSINAETFPGAVIAFGNNSGLIFLKAYGYHTYEKIIETKVSDIFDLASLTKVVNTTTAIMKLYDDGEIGLDDYYYKYLQNFKIDCNKKQQITIRQLLAHCSGFPSSNRYIRHNKFTTVHERWKELIENTQLEYESAANTIYSDVNFQILGKVVESISGKSLDEYIQENVYKHLDMNETFFNPHKKFIDRIVPTEYDPETNTFAKGYVHDPNARLLNGIAGHAGLFSTAENLSKFCRMILNEGIFNNKQIIKLSTIDLFSKKDNTIKKSSRALGWDTAYYPDLQNKSMSYSAGCFDENSFGHTGFTGTSIWLNLKKNFFAIILTNRVCPSRDHTNIEDYKKHIYRISSAIWRNVQ